MENIEFKICFALCCTISNFDGLNLTSRMLPNEIEIVDMLLRFVTMCIQS